MFAAININKMETTIKGTSSGYDQNCIIEWECPATGHLLSCQGEFAYDERGYTHDVYDADDNYLYTVIA